MSVETKNKTKEPFTSCLLQGRRVSRSVHFYIKMLHFLYYAAKCNLGKVKQKTNLASSLNLLSYMYMAGQSQDIAGPK